MKDSTETTKGGKGERTTETTQEGKGERTTDITHSRTDGDPLANQENTTTADEMENARALKGKMKETEIHTCTVNKSAYLQSQANTIEEESSATTATSGDYVESRDTSSMEFIKVKKKKGGKKNGVARGY
ncbi:hypothetical protein OIU77_027952 [Salix suchowensis]|uniref:Uncharacterized protein n=1 Tax=Salix suchowensis TaxID=1278906 RepID=A0ABQ9BUN7_9ROSI|nr:hypothetical protein OIU78_014625 [Salix suchowensis]KAJ6389734.1 hypothetical protein OIU77_027952 [Salix suchowensis]